MKIYRNIYRKNLSAIIYRLSISLLEIEIYRLSVSPRAFLKLSIIVIALVQKSLSCPSLTVVGLNARAGDRFIVTGSIHGGSRSHLTFTVAHRDFGKRGGGATADVFAVFT